jgi:uncharacterized protein with von Willebrand factor type A (vWA) domain
MYRTHWDPGYIPPSALRIHKLAEQLGVDTRALDTIRDLTALFSGAGTPVSVDEIRTRARHEAAQRPLKITENNQYMVPETGEVFARARDAQQRQRDVLFQHNVGMRDFMVHAAANPVIKGKSPMETAFYTFKAMKEALPEFNMEQRGGEHDEMAILGKLGMDPEMMRMMMGEQEKRWSALKDLDKWERAMLIGSDVYKLPGGKEVPVDYDDPNIEIEIARVLDSKMREALRISRQLRSLSNLNNPSFSRWRADPSGPEINWRRMKSLNELSQIRSSSLALLKVRPRLFRHKLVNREFNVRERGINRDQQQLLYVLIDGSGSMNGPRVAMATGALLNRLRSVVKGDAQLFYRMFDNSPHQEHAALDAAAALAAVKHLLKGSTFSGGGTNINAALWSGITAIKEKMLADPKLIKPEILLISDGEDNVSLTFEELGGIRLHSLVCRAGKQASLKRLCAASKGVYVHLD